MRFGRLTAQRLIENENTRGFRRWLCVCDCGHEKVAAVDTLRSGSTRSCGCLAAESARRIGRNRALPPGEAAFNCLYGNYRRDAKRKGLDFELSKGEARLLFTSGCYYCGAEPSLAFRGRTSFGPFICNGIDRLVNSYGYIKNNMVPCCKTCNYIKRSMHHNQFMQWLRQVWAHWRTPPDQLRMDTAMSMAMDPFFRDAADRKSFLRPREGTGKFAAVQRPIEKEAERAERVN